MVNAGCPRCHSDGSGVPIDFSCDSAETRGLRVFSSQEAGNYVNIYRVVKGGDDEVDICYYSDSYLLTEWLGITADRSLWSSDQMVHNETSACDSARDTNAADCITMLYHDCSMTAA